MDKRKTAQILKRLEEERQADNARIRMKAALPSGIIGRAGPDPEEYQKVNLSFSYDVEDDHLFATVGAPRPAVTRESKPGIYLRLDPEDYEIVGFEVLAFLRGDGEAKQLLNRVFPGLLAALEHQPDHAIELTVKKMRVRLRQLVPDNWPTVFQDPAVVSR